jgi:microcin C transport system permease protein
MSAYIIRRILFMIPKILGVLLVLFVCVQFAPGGPVARVIAKLPAGDGDATSAVRVEPY